MPAVITAAGEKSKTDQHITITYSYLMNWALEVDFHDKEAASAGHCYRLNRSLSCRTTVLLFSAEKMKHVTKTFEKERAKMARLVARFTNNNEECPFWPLFL